MTLSHSILATLAYHDIFDYPLTLPEVYHFFVGKKITQTQISRVLARLVKAKKIGTKDGYFYLKSRANIVNLRKRRSNWSKVKLKRASFFAHILKLIPTVKLVAISGALAMENSDKNDDIDLVLVSSKGTLWTTRFFANMLLLPFKRDPQSKKIVDRACLNIFIDETDLKIKPANLYIAHEIAQMKPLWDRDNTYQKFIKANSRIKKYLPNWTPSTEILDHRSQKSSPKTRLRTMNYPLRTIENLLKNFQLAYMAKKITTEKIGKRQLFFHPQDTQNRVIGEYQKRLRRLNAAKFGTDSN